MNKPPGWLKRRSGQPGIDWDFITYWVLTGLFVGIGAATLWAKLPKTVSELDGLFTDATLYFKATEAWVSGGNPWATRLTPGGPPFAGPPTTLLLNLPLLPFGPSLARPFWACAGFAGWVIAVRRLGLGPWWIMFPPFLEGWLAGSPDPALFGLIVVGWGAVAAMAKPYSVPAMLADGHWRAVLVGAAVAAASVPLLPWGLFFTQLDAVQEAFATYSLHVSVWGDPVLMVVVGIALVTLGRRLGFRLVVPSLWPGAQLHYLTFSASVGAESAFLGLALAFPKAAPIGIILFAIWLRLRPVVNRAVERMHSGVPKSTLVTTPAPGREPDEVA